MKFFPASFRRYSRTETNVPQHTLAAYDPATNQAFLNIHDVSSPEAGAYAAERAREAFAAGKFTPSSSENWRPCSVDIIGVPA